MADALAGKRQVDPILLIEILLGKQLHANVRKVDRMFLIQILLARHLHANVMYSTEIFSRW